MRKAQFIKEVLKQKPIFKNIDTCFYVLPVEHVVSGFVCNMKSSGADVLQFVYPLFERFPVLHFTYNRQKSYSYIDYKNKGSKELAKEFLLRIEENIKESYDYLSLDGFCKFIQENERELSTAKNYKVMGYAAILAEDKTLVKRCLKKALFFNGRTKLKKFEHEECEQVLDLVENNPDEAKKLLLNWEAEMKKKFNIQS